MFVRLIWIASDSSLTNILSLFYFEMENTACIEMHTCTHMQANPMYCYLFMAISLSYLGASSGRGVGEGNFLYMA